MVEDAVSDGVSSGGPVVEPDITEVTDAASFLALVREMRNSNSNQAQHAANQAAQIALLTNQQGDLTATLIAVASALPKSGDP